MSSPRSQQKLIRLGLLSLSVTGTLLNLRLRSIINPHDPQSQSASGEALVNVLKSEEYCHIKPEEPADRLRLLQCFCLSILSLTHGFPTDTNLEKFIHATAAVFSDPEQDEAVLSSLEDVIIAGHRKLQNDLRGSEQLTEQELHGNLFRHLYVTVKRLERILTRHNETRGERSTRDVANQTQANLHPVSV